MSYAFQINANMNEIMQMSIEPPNEILHLHWMLRLLYIQSKLLFKTIFAFMNYILIWIMNAILS